MLPLKTINSPKALFGLVVAIVFIALLIYWTKPVQSPILKEVRPLHVVVTTVDKRDIYPFITAAGRLIPEKTANLQFEVSGHLRARQVQAGQKVEQGTLLLELDDQHYRLRRVEYQSHLDTEKAAILRDEILLAIASKNLDLQTKAVQRLEKLRRDSLASRSNLEAALQKKLQLQAEQTRLQFLVDTATSRLHLQQARLKLAQRDVTHTQLYAPFDGIINRIHVAQGDRVAPGKIAVEIIATRFLDLYLELQQQAIASLTLGQEVSVSINGSDVRGFIQSLQTSPHPSTQTYPVTIRIDGTNLLPGMLANATIPLPPYLQVLTVPVTALLHDTDQQDYVFVVENDLAKKTAVTRLMRFQNRWLIASGLQPGQQIVARDIAALSDNMAILVTETSGI